MRNKIIKNWNRILVTCPHNLGDFIAKLPLIRLLKTNKPGCEVVLCCRGYVKELVQSVQEVDQMVDFEQLFSQEEDKIVEALKELNIDTVIHLLSQQKSMGPDVLGYAKQAGITNRVGNLNKSAFSFWMKRNEHHITHNLCSKRIIEGMHEFQWNLTPLKFFGIKNSYSLDSFSDLLKVEIHEEKSSPYLSKERFNLILHPGSHGNAKEWPEFKFRELIDLLDEKKFQVLITGSKEEALKYKGLDLKKENLHFLMGQFSLGEFISFIHQCDGIVAASTGPIHIASLSSTHILGLFPKQKRIGAGIWGPLGENASYIESPGICSACEKKLTDFNPNLCTCMEAIEATEVQNRISLWRNQ